jgi:hypothetical protein
VGQFDYQRTVIAYHGCDESIVSGVLLHGEKLKVSKNAYDWLGKGIYFWEHGPQRALEWAQNPPPHGVKIKRPAVLGALINLGHCFDLLDTRNTALLPQAYEVLRLVHDYTKDSLPGNRQAKGEAASDFALRYLDCAVINLAIEMREKESERIVQTVRGSFTEGKPAFENSKIMQKSHIQIAVRDANAIIGYFRPVIDTPPL